MAIRTLVNGAWEDIEDLPVPVNGAYESADHANALVNEAWEEVWSAKGDYYISPYPYTGGSSTGGGSNSSASYSVKVDENNEYVTVSLSWQSNSGIAAIFYIHGDFIFSHSYNVKIEIVELNGTTVTDMGFCITPFTCNSSNAASPVMSSTTGNITTPSITENITLATRTGNADNVYPLIHCQVSAGTANSGGISAKLRIYVDNKDVNYSSPE